MILTGIGHSREVQADELKLGHVAFLVSMEDLQGEVTRLVYLGLRWKVRAAEIGK